LLDNQRSNPLYYQTQKKATLIIKISAIEDKLVVRGNMESSQFTRTDENEFVSLSPVSYELTIKKIEDLVTVEGPISCTLTMTCVKCLDEFTLPMNVNLDIELAPRVPTPHISELELKNNDMDVYYYEGDEIDLDPFVYDEVVLNIPMRPVCKEECKGLCDVCGKNKNYEECNCNKVSDTLLGEKLKSFLT
jgi:uncharacterized protein